MSPETGQLFVFYWSLWITLSLLPLLLRREERRLERWEILEVHPEYARRLWVRSAIRIVHGLLAIAGLLFVLNAERFAFSLSRHFAALVYGSYLLVEALLAWRTGVRVVSSGFRVRFTLEEEISWKTKLELALAGGYLLIPIVFLAVGAFD